MWWLKIVEIYSFTVLEGRSLKVLARSRSLQRFSGRILLLSVSGGSCGSWAYRNIAPVSAPAFKGPSLCLYMSFIFCLVRTFIIGFRAYPNSE